MEPDGGKMSHKAAKSGGLMRADESMVNQDKLHNFIWTKSRQIFIHFLGLSSLIIFLGSTSDCSLHSPAKNASSTLKSSFQVLSNQHARPKGADIDCFISALASLTAASNLQDSSLITNYTLNKRQLEQRPAKLKSNISSASFLIDQQDEAEDKLHSRRNEKATAIFLGHQSPPRSSNVSSSSKSQRGNDRRLQSERLNASRSGSNESMLIPTPTQFDDDHDDLYEMPPPTSTGRPLEVTGSWNDSSGKSARDYDDDEQNSGEEDGNNEAPQLYFFSSKTFGERHPVSSTNEIYNNDDTDQFAFREAAKTGSPKSKTKAATKRRAASSSNNNNNSTAGAIASQGFKQLVNSTAMSGNINKSPTNSSILEDYPQLTGHLAPTTNEYHLLLPRESMQNNSVGAESTPFLATNDRQKNYTTFSVNNNNDSNNSTGLDDNSISRYPVELPIASLSGQQDIMSMRLVSNSAPELSQVFHRQPNPIVAQQQTNLNHSNKNYQLDPLLLSSDVKVTSELLVLNNSSPIEGLAAKHLAGSIMRHGSTRDKHPHFATMTKDDAGSKPKRRNQKNKTALSVNRRGSIKWQPPVSGNLWLGQISTRPQVAPASFAAAYPTRLTAPAQAPVGLLVDSEDLPGSKEEETGTGSWPHLRYPVRLIAHPAGDFVEEPNATARTGMGVAYASPEPDQSGNLMVDDFLGSDQRSASTVTTDQPAVDDGEFVSERLATISINRKPTQSPAKNRTAQALRLAPTASMTGIRVIADPNKMDGLVMNSRGLIMAAPKRNKLNKTRLSGSGSYGSLTADSLRLSAQATDLNAKHSPSGKLPTIVQLAQLNSTDRGDNWPSDTRYQMAPGPKQQLSLSPSASLSFGSSLAGSRRKNQSNLQPAYDLLDTTERPAPFLTQNPLRWNVTSSSFDDHNHLQSLSIYNETYSSNELQNQMVSHDLTVMDEASDEPSQSQPLASSASFGLGGGKQPAKDRAPLRVPAANWPNSTASATKRPTPQPVYSKSSLYNTGNSSSSLSGNQLFSSSTSFYHNPPYNKHHHQSVSSQSTLDTRTTQPAPFGSRPSASLAAGNKRPADRKPQTSGSSTVQYNSNTEPADGYQPPATIPPYESSAAISSLNSSLINTLSGSETNGDRNQTAGSSNATATGSNGQISSALNSQKPVKLRNKLQNMIINKLLKNTQNLNNLTSSASGPQPQWTSPGSGQQSASSTTQTAVTPAPLLSSTVANNVAGLLAQKLNFLVRPSFGSSQHYSSSGYGGHSHGQQQAASSLNLGSLFGIRMSSAANGSGSSTGINKYKQRLNPFLPPQHSHHAVNRRTAGMGSLLISGFIYGLSVLPALMALTGINPLSDGGGSSSSDAGSGGSLATGASNRHSSSLAANKKRAPVTRFQRGPQMQGAGGSYAYLVPLVPSLADSSLQANQLDLADQSQQSALKSLYAPAPTIIEPLGGGSDLHPVLDELPPFDSTPTSMGHHHHYPSTHHHQQQPRLTSGGSQPALSVAQPPLPNSLHLANTMQLANERLHPYSRYKGHLHYARPFAPSSTADWSPPDRADSTEDPFEMEDADGDSISGGDRQFAQNQRRPQWQPQTSQDRYDDSGAGTWRRLNHDSLPEAKLIHLIDPILMGNSNIHQVVAKDSKHGPPKTKGSSKAKKSVKLPLAKTSLLTNNGNPSRSFQVGYTLNYTPVPLEPQSSTSSLRVTRHKQHVAKLLDPTKTKFIEFQSFNEPLDKVATTKGDSDQIELLQWRPVAGPMGGKNNQRVKYNLNQALTKSAKTKTNEKELYTDTNNKLRIQM